MNDSNPRPASAVFGTPVCVEGVGRMGMAVALDGARLFAGAGPVLYALDVSDPLRPRILGSLGGFDNLRQIRVRGNFAYVVSRETGLRLVDVSDPAHMRLRSRYDTVEMATGIEVVGDVAFVSERIYGIEAVDVRDPDNPAHIALRKTFESQSCRYRDGFLFSGEWGCGEITVFDARDLRDWRIVGKADLGGHGDGLELDGDLLYCSTGHHSLHRGIEGDEARGRGRGLDIFDISDPPHPRHLARVDFPRFLPHEDDYWTPRVANGWALCCDSHNGLFAVDVHDVSHPVVRDRLCIPEPGRDWPSGAISSLEVGEGCLYMTCRPGGLYVIPVEGVHPQPRPTGTAPIGAEYREKYNESEVRSPKSTHRQELRTPDSRLRTSGEFAVRCSQFAVEESRTSDLGLRTQDFGLRTSDFLHTYRPEAAGQARSVAVRGDVAYVAFGDAGLHALRLTEDGFEKLGELPGGHRVTDCCLAGNQLLVAEGLDGFALYDLPSPADFREVARRPGAGTAGSVAFWCWAPCGGHIALSARDGSYAFYRLADFADPAARPVVLDRACAWHRYPADRAAANGAYPVPYPYVGIAWMDLSGDAPRIAADAFGAEGSGVVREVRSPKSEVHSPKSQVPGPKSETTQLRTANCELRTSQKSEVPSPNSDAFTRVVTDQRNGVCLLGDRFLCTVSDGYVLLSPDGSATPWRRLGPDGHRGAPRTDGRLVLLTERSGRRATVWDFADPDSPRLLHDYSLSGNPDLGAFWRGRALFPAGHQGLLMER